LKQQLGIVGAQGFKDALVVSFIAGLIEERGPD